MSESNSKAATDHMSAQLNTSEKAFVKRMAIHVAIGMSFDDAAKQVLLDDSRIAATILASKDDAAKMRSALAADIYFNVRKNDAIDQALAPEDMATRIRRLAGEDTIYSGPTFRQFTNNRS